MERIESLLPLLPTNSGNGSRGTQQVILSTSGTNELHYQPGDHVAILPANRKELVEAVLSRLQQCPDPDQPIQVLLLKELHSINGQHHKVLLCV